jgi:hypothetical protein
MSRCSCAVLSLVAVVFLAVASAGADPQNMNQLLKGDYAFSGAGSCLAANLNGAGFSPTLQPLSPVTSFGFMVEGVRTFNGDGTGSVTGHSVSVTQPGRINEPDPLNGPLGEGGISATDSTFSATFSYQVAPDGRTFTAHHADFTITFTAGPRTGQSATLSPAEPDEELVPIAGHISNDLKTLVFGTAHPAVEVITFLGPLVGPQHRICHRSRTAVKIK